MSTQTPDIAASAREAAREGDGKFGTQEHGRPERGLMFPGHITVDNNIADHEDGAKFMEMGALMADAGFEGKVTSSTTYKLDNPTFTFTDIDGYDFSVRAHPNDAGFSASAMDHDLWGMTMSDGDEFDPERAKEVLGDIVQSAKYARAVDAHMAELGLSDHYDSYTCKGEFPDGSFFRGPFASMKAGGPHMDLALTDTDGTQYDYEVTGDGTKVSRDGVPLPAWEADAALDRFDRHFPERPVGMSALTHLFQTVTK